METITNQATEKAVLGSQDSQPELIALIKKLSEKTERLNDLIRRFNQASSRINSFNVYDKTIKSSDENPPHQDSAMYNLYTLDNVINHNLNDLNELVNNLETIV